MGGVEWVVVLVMVGFNSVFAGYEIALASVTLARLRLLAGENQAGARAALFMKENMEGSLAVVQLGITLAGAIAAATGGSGAKEDLAPWLQERLTLSAGLAHLLALTLVVVPLTAVTIMFGELVPKVFALRNKEWVCLRLSPAMRWFAYSVWPAVWLFETGVKALMSWGERRWQSGRGGPTPSEAAELQELRAIATLARTSRLIGEREEGIILNAVRLSSRPVREILLPAEHIGMLHANDSLADSLVAAHLDLHTRFPVAERPGDPQSILGYVNFKDLVSLLRLSPKEPTLRAVVRAIPSLPDDLPLTGCLERLVRERTHIALVRDVAGRVVGMITLEDILEELVGDIQDEFDRLPAHATASGSAWVVGGGIDLARLKEVTGLDLAGAAPAPSSSTLSEWVVGHLGRPVRGGDVVEQGGVRVVVRKVRRHKVQEAQVSRTTPTGPASAGTPAAVTVR